MDLERQPHPLQPEAYSDKEKAHIKEELKREKEAHAAALKQRSVLQLACDELAPEDAGYTLVQEVLDVVEEQIAFLENRIPLLEQEHEFDANTQEYREHIMLQGEAIKQLVFLTQLIEEQTKRRDELYTLSSTKDVDAEIENQELFLIQLRDAHARQHQSCRDHAGRARKLKELINSASETQS